MYFIDILYFITGVAVTNIQSDLLSGHSRHYKLLCVCTRIVEAKSSALSHCTITTAHTTRAREAFLCIVGCATTEALAL